MVRGGGVVWTGLGWAGLRWRAELVCVVMGSAAVIGLWMMDSATVVRAVLGFRAGWLVLRVAVVVDGRAAVVGRCSDGPAGVCPAGDGLDASLAGGFRV